MIDVRGLTKAFGTKAVLRGIDLQFRRGEVAVILGPSGCGKSTFLRCLNGLEEIQGGTIRVDDSLELTPDLSPDQLRGVLRQVRLRIGMVFQGFHLFPHRSVLENVIEAPIHVRGLGRDEAVARARALLDRVGMGAFLDRRPGALSGGEQQRVAIARTLAMGPEAILFDEPTSSLDPRMAAEVLAVMADLARDGQTMIVVTHDLGFARRAAHVVHLFENGLIARSGTPAEMAEQLIEV